MGLDLPFSLWPPGMPNAVGALLPALVSALLVLSGNARSRLGPADHAWLVGLALALTVVTARMVSTPEETTLHTVPGAPPLLLYLVWRGKSVSPGYGFALTFATMLPVDVLLARYLTGPEFNLAAVGGAGWGDALLIIPSLTAMGIMYANWRREMGACQSG